MGTAPPETLERLRDLHARWEVLILRNLDDNRASSISTAIELFLSGIFHDELGLSWKAKILACQRMLSAEWLATTEGCIRMGPMQPDRTGRVFEPVMVDDVARELRISPELSGLLSGEMYPHASSLMLSIWMAGDGPL